MLNTPDETISVYMREQAVQDGLLIDVSDMAKRAGILLPTAITQNLWDTYINIGDPEGRLWDLLWIFRLKAIRSESDFMSFNMSFEKNGSCKLVNVWAHLGPGDFKEPVITLMLPEDY